MPRLILLILAVLAAFPAAAAAQNGVSYRVPADNPFVGQAGAAPEVYSLGLRNPWRFSFDRLNGAIFIGDVGGAAREELDYRPQGGARGANFGWSCREGTIAGPRSCTGSFTAPIFDYQPPSGGQAVTAGYVVRDPALTGLGGRLLYADFFAGDIRSVTSSGTGDASTGANVPQLASFGQDAQGRLYALGLGGTVYRLVSNGSGALTRTAVAGSYSAPTYATSPPGDASRLFVVERPGRVQLVLGGVKQARPFLDLSSQISTDGERGLLSVAFAPDYATSGRFYAFYTDPNGDSRIEEFRRSANPNVATLAGRRTVLTVEHSANANHYGGQLQFGPDRLLYISTGDGGSQGDPPNNAQNRASLSGKILRIDPRPPSGARDTTGPLLRTKVTRRQRVRRNRGVVGYGRCLSESCTVAMSARLRIGKRSFKLRYTTKRGASGQRVRIKARLTKRAARALRRAQMRKRRARVSVALRARDAAGNPSALRKTTVRVRHSRPAKKSR